MMALVVRTSALSAEPSFVIGCDDAVLRWIGQAFRRRLSFRIGDGYPVGSDGRCLIDVQRGTPEACSEIAAGQFRWVLPAERAEHYAGLIDGMADCPVGCHQYLAGIS